MAEGAGGDETAERIIGTVIFTYRIFAIREENPGPNKRSMSAVNF
jgi:hypothetical protein